MARKRNHWSEFNLDWSESDPDWSPSKASSSGTSPTPKKRKSSTTTSPNTDSSTEKKAVANRTRDSLTPVRQAVSREIFPDDEDDKSSLIWSSSKWLLCEYCKRK